MYLVDTNVISESRKGAAANLGVLDCSQVWGRLMSPQSSHPVDKQIAAIALIHGLYVVTRNIADFSTTGVNCSTRLFEAGLRRGILGASGNLVGFGIE